METKIFSIEELKNLFIQELLNKSDGKVSKVSDHSVLNGIAFGFSKVFQKSMKDVALLESELFPEYAFGEYLDKIALRYGISERQKNLGSSVYVKIVANPGSVYLAANCSFISTDGATFSLVENFTVNDNGWGYALLKSDETGSNTNVRANTINRVTGQPAGHLYVNNELPAIGGVDVESDESLLQRIMQNFNNFSFETLDKLTYVFQKINPSVLQVRNIGLNEQGQTVLSVITSTGASLSNDELQVLTDKSLPYMSLHDLYVTNGLSGGPSFVKVQNIEAVPIDLDFRIQLDADVNLVDFKVSCQEAILSLLDFVSKDITKVEWEDLFSIIRTQTGVIQLPEQYFYAGDSSLWNSDTPHKDISVPVTKIPRLRMFVVRNIDGSVIFSNERSGQYPLAAYYYGPDYTNVFDQVNNTIGIEV